MDYAALRAEIDTGPLCEEFINQSDDFVADILNDTSRFNAIKSRFVTARTVMAELTEGVTILSKLEAVESVIPAVKWAMIFLRQEGGLDIGHTNTQAQLDGLVAAAVLSSTEGAALKNLALLPISRCEQLGWQPITYNDVNIARAL